MIELLSNCLVQDCEHIGSDRRPGWQPAPKTLNIKTKLFFTNVVLVQEQRLRSRKRRCEDLDCCHFLNPSSTWEV